ncbi:MAG: hypothetical protein ACREL4_03840, partial [Gemmatimonadales bacterium]
SNAISRPSILKTLASSNRSGALRRTSWLLAWCLAAWPAGRVAAQRPLIAAGTVSRVVNGDTVGVARVRVVFHHVSSHGSGPIDSVISDARGAFRFVLGHRDTTATYLVSAKYAGVAYFSAPVGTDPRLDRSIRLVVADTSSGPTAPVSLEARHVVIERPDAEGVRPVTDLLVLQNPGPDTRVAPDTVRATWGVRLPRGVVDPVAGDGDFSPDAVRFRNDSILIFAPISLGEAQMVVRYSLPASSGVVGLPVEDSVPSFNVLVEEGGARVEGGQLAPAAPEQLGGRSFLHWSGAVPAGAMVSVRLGGGGALPGWLLPSLLGLMALALIPVCVRALRGRGATAVASPPAATELIDRVARLDVRFGGREAETPPAEWQGYLAERARLVRALDATLVRDPTAP